MASFAEQVAQSYLSGIPRARLRELCRDWKRLRTPYSVSNVIPNAAEDGCGRELHETLLDEDFRILRQQVSGINGLREDIRTGLDYFSGRQPDLLKYLQVRFLEPGSLDQEFVAAHEQHCQGFTDFLQLDQLPHERRPVGLHKVLLQHRFFPACPKPDRPGSVGGQPVIGLAGYELGMWRCRCGALAGLGARYRFSCPCGVACGTGRLGPGTAACAACGTRPSYLPCASCGTRVTLENLWRFSEDDAHPSVYQIPLVLHLHVRHLGRDAESARLPLMLLPIPLGTREREGSIFFGLPDVLWLRHRSAASATAEFVGLGDALRYDRQTELRRILEDMFRRTLLRPYERRLDFGSYQDFANYIADRLRDGRASAPGYFTAAFQRRIRERLAPRGGADRDMLRFIEVSADCVVAASPALRGNAALASSRFAGSPLLSVPHLLSVRADLNDGDSLTASPRAGGARRVALLDPSGLVRPGQTAQPGQVLAGITRRPTQYGRLIRADARDASLCMPGGRAGRVLEQHVSIGSPAAEEILPAPGRTVDTGGTPGITMTIAVDRPLEAGDTLRDGTASDATAVVCGVLSAWELSQVTGTGSGPDIVVAPDHPWAPPAGEQTGHVRVHLSKDDPAAHDMRFRGLGSYSLKDQPILGAQHPDAAALVTPREFRWLIGRQARNLALELYGPRSDCGPWRPWFQESLAGSSPAVWFPAGRPLAEWASLSDSPSSAVLKWERLLRCARIRSVICRGRVSFHFMTDAEVLELSHGEVKEFEGFPPEGPRAGGVFSERIFGPVGGWEECACGKCHGPAAAGTACDECGVDPAGRDARRHRMGHIDLPVAVVHPWFLRGTPQERLASALQTSTEELAQITECARYVVADPGTTALRRGQTLPAGDGGVSEGVLLATGGEAIEILLQQAAGPREPGLTAAHVVIRKVPVLPPALRIDISSRPYRHSNLNLHYWAILRWVTRDWLRGEKSGAPAPQGIHRSWHSGLQRSVDALFGCVAPPPDNKGADGVPGTPRSIADHLCPQDGGSVRDGFLTRPTDFSASAKLVTSDTGDADTALLPAKMIQALLQPVIAKAQARTRASGKLLNPRGHRGTRDPQAGIALDEHLALAVVLVSFPAGPWPLVAVRVKSAADQAIHVHPDLLDQVGWDNLGQTVKIFSVLTDPARLEAEHLLTPARLRAATADTLDAGTPGQPTGNSVFDLTPGNLTDALVQAAWTGASFSLLPEDSLLLCAADWAAG